MEILDKTGQGKISESLRKGDFKEDRLQRKEAEWQIKLRKCFVLLVEDLEVNDVLVTYLCQEELLSVENTERLEFLTNPDKKHALLNILRRKPFFFKKHSNVRDVFIKALKELGGKQHLIDTINKTEITEEDYREYEGIYNKKAEGLMAQLSTG